MRTYQARMVIPNHWAESGRCPICNLPTLHVARQTGQPDQMACSSCGCGFEIEVDGPDIRLTWISPEYKHMLFHAEGIWMSVVDLRHQITQPVEEEAGAQIENSQAEQLDQMDDLQVQTPTRIDPVNISHNDSQHQEEIIRRAIDLADLGNGPDRIRSTLAKSGISEVMILIALEEVRSRKQKKKSPVALVLIIMIIFVVGCLVVAAIFLPKFNLRSLIGLINAPMGSSDPSRNPVTPAPISAGIGLPPDGGQYFNVMWNLTGSYQEKANQMSSIFPPADLGNIHSQLIDNFNQTGYLELIYQRCKAEYDQQNCAEIQNMGNAFCKEKNMECSKDNLLFLEGQTKLYALWLGRACESFEDYYSKNDVGFPFPDGNCAYP